MDNQEQEEEIELPSPAGDEDPFDHAFWATVSVCAVIFLLQWKVTKTLNQWSMVSLIALIVVSTILPPVGLGVAVLALLTMMFKDSNTIIPALSNIQGTLTGTSGNTTTTSNTPGANPTSQFSVPYAGGVPAQGV